MNNVRQAFDRRLLLTTCFFFASLGILIARLMYLQLARKEELYEASIKNFTRYAHVPFPRGNIVDCYGELLATNRPLVNLVWHGTGNRVLTDYQKSCLQSISNLLGIDLGSEMPSIKITERFQREMLIARDISFDQITKLAELYGGNENIKFEHHFERFYPHSSLASHIVGYLGKYDLEAIGKSGLEKVLQNQLRGIDALEQRTINSVGRALNAQRIRDGNNGATVVTTIDRLIQQLAEEAFPEDMSGALILMEPRTGAIRALLSRPNFDPSLFLRPISPEVWQELVDKQPFLNRALTALYPPASLFKLISVSAALELGLITQDSRSFCCGHTMFCGRKYHCNKLAGHGNLDLTGVLAKSCNIMLYDLGKRMSIDTLASYAHKFGLGKPTGILFEEKTGIVPSSQWKRAVKGERWWPGETLSAMIGQSYHLCTPMQIARMFSAIYQGYLVRPRMLEEEEIVKEPFDIRPETRRFLKRSMKAAVQTGSGVRISYVRDIKAYFKTGTAQISSMTKREEDSSFLEHGWLAGTFRYKDNEALTLVLIMEKVGTSRVSIGIAQKFLRSYKAALQKLEKEGIVRQKMVVNAHATDTAEAED